VILVLQLIPFSTECRDSCFSKWQLFCCSIISASETVVCCESGARIFVTRFFFVRKGVRLLLMIVLLAELGHLALGLVWQSPWCFCFVLLEECLNLQGTASNPVL